MQTDLVSKTTRVTTRENTRQHHTTRDNTSKTRVKHDTTRLQQETARVQYDTIRVQHEDARAAKIRLYFVLFVTTLCIFLFSSRNS